MYINGHDNKADVIQNVIENIDDGLLANAKDMLSQLKEVELDVENVNMLGINADNVDEVISENA